MAELTDILASESFRALQRSGVTVTASTNVFPAFTVFDANASGPSLLDLLGIKTHVVARTESGKVLAEYGEPVTINPALMIAYGAVLVLGVVSVGAVISRLLR